MQKLLQAMMLMIVSLLLASSAAFAHKSRKTGPEQDVNPGCSEGHDFVCVDTMGFDRIASRPAPVDTDPATTQLPLQGVVAAGGDPTANSAYAYSDGNSSNPGALNGYLGVNQAEESSTAPLAGDNAEHYHRNGMGNSSFDPSALAP